MAVRLLPRRLLLITFDLRHPRPGDARYRAVDRYLSGIGQASMPLKQTRLLLTAMSATAVLAGIRAQLGLRDGVMVVRVSRRSRFWTWDIALRAAVRQLIRQHGSP